MQEKPRSSIKELLNLRKKFAPGEEGKRSFGVIAKGAQCDYVIDRNDGTGGKSVCGQPGESTVEFNIPRFGGRDILVGCSDAHAKGIIRTIFEQHSGLEITRNGFPLDLEG